MNPPVSTYSIVARCPESGQLGVAVQSHHFASGAVVPWVRAGVGAVATQGFSEIGYGPAGLDRMACGDSAKEALRIAVEADPGSALRQVAMVDASGGVACHTGEMSVPTAGSFAGAGYSVQGNMLASEDVWKSMSEAFEARSGDLADRLLGALDAAQQAGGDLRGRKSAAIVVVAGERGEFAWEGRLIDVRVDEHPEPLAELRRLVGFSRAYGLLRQAQKAVARGDLQAALRWTEEARNLAPGEPDLPFWSGVALAVAGRLEEAQALLDEVFALGDGWRELALGIQKRGLLPPGIRVRPRG